MWELDHKESFQCFWTVVLVKAPQSPLDCKDSQPVHPKGNQSCIFIGKTDAKAEAPILWPPDVKNWLTGKDPDAGKDWRQEEKGTAEDEMVGWHHRLNDHEFEHVLGVTVGQGSLACSSPWSCKELDMTEWIELIWTVSFWSIISRSNVELYMKFATAIQNESSSTVLSMMREKELLYRYHGVIFSKGRVELNPARNQNLFHRFIQEWNCSLPSISYCWQFFSSTISHPLSLLWLITLLACSLDASPCMPALLLYYWTLQGTIV